MIEDTVKQVREIQAKIQAAQDCQKSYADLKRREEEFDVGDKVLLKVSPMKGVMRFGKKGKLSPKYIGPYEILQKIGKVAYRLALLMELSKVLDVFHVSQLRRYIPDKSHGPQPETIELDQSLTYEERPVKIFDSKVCSTRNKNVKIVKVLWSNQEYKEDTWEAKEEMKKKYPEMFQGFMLVSLHSIGNLRNLSQNQIEEQQPVVVSDVEVSSTSVVVSDVEVSDVEVGSTSVVVVVPVVEG
ncbi:uncharacterized protein LOC110732010 [Chenopodium quinoa]|uniref:uncharacterized protein LOC110732010 n=1 Tax=Chenopodium quinoa TaxID=63459 RepID=UPI000B76FB07|nr:uncharacterized protein LOC110732010 [Chenopodium quinoa]